MDTLQTALIEMIANGIAENKVLKADIETLIQEIEQHRIDKNILKKQLRKQDKEESDE